MSLSDIHCAEDLDPYFTVVENATALMESVFRRLNTPTGAHPDDVDYGFDVRSYLFKPLDIPELKSLENRIRIECRKEKTVIDARIQILFNQTTNGLVIKIRLVTEEETFSFSVSLDSNNVTYVKD